MYQDDQAVTIDNGTPETLVGFNVMTGLNISNHLVRSGDKQSTPFSAFNWSYSSVPATQEVESIYGLWFKNILWRLYGQEETSPGVFVPRSRQFDSLILSARGFHYETGVSNAVSSFNFEAGGSSPVTVNLPTMASKAIRVERSGGGAIVLGEPQDFKILYEAEGIRPKLIGNSVSIIIANTDASSPLSLNLDSSFFIGDGYSIPSMKQVIGFFTVVAMQSSAAGAVRYVQCGTWREYVL